MASLVWDDGTTLHAPELLEGSASVVGRSVDATVRIDHPTVSRQHAVVRMTDDGAVVENLSQTNPVRLNGANVRSHATMADGDRIELGQITVVFHDLRAVAVHTALLNCSHCGRENPLEQRDCWYCGTSLVNAPTVMPGRRNAACRIAPPGQRGESLFASDSLRILDGGNLRRDDAQAPPAQAAAAVAAGDDGRVMLTALESSPVAVNGTAVGGATALAHSDVITAGGTRYVALLR